MIGGLFASLCTPFSPSGDLDLEGLRSIVRFGLESGTDGFLCTALAGEVAELTDEERRAVAATVLEEVAGRVPVIVGVARDDDDKAASLARFAAKSGAACILVPARPAPLERPANCEVLELLLSIVGAEIMVQEAPRYSEARYGLTILAQLAETLAVPPHVKVEGGPRQLEEVRAALGDAVPTWGGDGGLYLLDCLRSGAVGVIPGVEVIDWLTAAFRAESSGEADVADEILRSLLPYLVFAMQSQAQYVSCAKWVLHRRGLIDSAAARTPGAALGDSQSGSLSSYFAHIEGREPPGGTGAGKPLLRKDAPS